jgi:hypothetical protein
MDIVEENGGGKQQLTSKLIDKWSKNFEVVNRCFDQSILFLYAIRLA